VGVGSAWGNEYHGIATVQNRTVTQDDVTVNVTADSANSMWQVPPGGLLPLITQAPTIAPSWGSP
jgi:hypothetical protein